MVNFDTRTLSINGHTLIANGQVTNDYEIPNRVITMTDIERLYNVYENSVPDRQCKPSIFRAKSESELSLHDIVFGKKRSEIQNTLEQTLLEGILNKTLEYPDMNKWFWQSPVNKNLIIPRWIFTQECHKNIAYSTEKPAENELWDRNIAGRKIRQILNTEDPSDEWFDNISLRECFLTVKEELSELNTPSFFTQDIVDDLLKQYMSTIPKCYGTLRANTGQYVSRIRKAKTKLNKIRAIDDLVKNCPFKEIACNSDKWRIAYRRFIDYRTLMFIQEFIPGTSQINITENIDDYTKTYIEENMAPITAYVNNH